MKKSALIFINLLICLKVFAPEPTMEQQDKRFKYFLRQQEQSVLYEEMIAFTKQMEGLRLNRYKCPAGLKTIGYGHILNANENYWQIDENIADSLVRADFDYALSFVPENMQYNKRLSIAHFIFNCGIGTYNNSKLKKSIDNNQPIDIILRYCFYKKDGEWVKSGWLYKARLFEYQFYNRKTQFL